MAPGCCVTPPSGSGWSGEPTGRVQTISVTPGEVKGQTVSIRRFIQFTLVQEQKYNVSNYVMFYLKFAQEPEIELINKIKNANYK